MMAMPICESMVIAKLLVKSCGATNKSTANMPQINQRPTLMGLNS